MPRHAELQSSTLLRVVLCVLALRDHAALTSASYPIQSLPYISVSAIAYLPSHQLRVAVRSFVFILDFRRL
jgi:hypothetical protein